MDRSALPYVLGKDGISDEPIGLIGTLDPFFHCFTNEPKTSEIELVKRTTLA